MELLQKITVALVPLRGSISAYSDLLPLSLIAGGALQDRNGRKSDLIPDISLSNGPRKDRIGGKLLS